MIDPDEYDEEAVLQEHRGEYAAPPPDGVLRKVEVLVRTKRVVRVSGELWQGDQRKDLAEHWLPLKHVRPLSALEIGSAEPLLIDGWLAAKIMAEPAPGQAPRRTLDVSPRELARYYRDVADSQDRLADHLEKGNR